MDMMKLKTDIKATHDCIRHWEEVKKGNEVVSVDTCALCQIYNNKAIKFEKRCVGCPIYEKTKKKYCGNTPYKSYVTHLNNCDDVYHDCDNEIEFLKEISNNLEEKYNEKSRDDRTCLRIACMAAENTLKLLNLHPVLRDDAYIVARITETLTMLTQTLKETD